MNERHTEGPDAYRPVSCDLHDVLEAAASLGRSVELEVTGPDGQRSIRRARIRDLFSRDKVEYALLEDGESVRLDRLVLLDSMALRK